MQAEILLTPQTPAKRSPIAPHRAAETAAHRLDQPWRQTGGRRAITLDAINEMNQLAEQTVVERATGGKGGGGAQPTFTHGQRLIQLYDLLGRSKS